MLYLKLYLVLLLYVVGQLMFVFVCIVYVGDDLCDIQVGSVVGMVMVVVVYGYCGDGIVLVDWQVQYFVDMMQELWDLLCDVGL